jgi:hypothetical protein
MMITKKQLIESLMANNLPDETPVYHGKHVDSIDPIYRVTIQTKVYDLGELAENPFPVIILS